ncbi:MAG: aldehyde ferredoxin oxidoreductase family protein [Proteobacteria bacterium]|nr:aldehyde ferredoxin oxidoreductase family protein [Pseudomonadota bacterium]
MYGWIGQVLRVDLTGGAISSEPLDTNLAHNFIGGRGIYSRILYNEVGPDASSLSPQNVLIFGSSPLSGTAAPSSPRCTVSAKSPLTGILGDANFGGFFSRSMKLAGFDHIVITGRAAAPVFLYINDGRAEIREAQHLWGKTTDATAALLKKQFRGEKVQIACTGPAGEHMVRTACIVHGYNVAGRTGMGAVMGSKQLKAVVIGKGTHTIETANAKELRSVVRHINKKIKSSPFYKMFSTYGMAGPLAIENESGLLAIKNFKQAGGWEHAEDVTSETLARDFYTGSSSCFSCRVGCMKSWEVKEGPYAGLKGTKIPEGCTSYNGPTCGNFYAPSLFKIYSLCNQYGIDVLDFGCLMSYVMEWYEKGIISQEETGGFAFEWGNYESMIAMIPRIAKREGFGAVLADGAVHAAQQVGRGAEKSISHCKGMVLGGVDIRGLKGTALTFATATRGCDHLRGSNMIEIPLGGRAIMSNDEAIRRFGTAHVLEHDSYDKASSTIYFQDIYTLADALQICKFNTSHNGHGINIQDMAEIYSAVTGVAADEKGMRIIADRIYSVERCFLAREGIRKDDDFLQGKWAEEATVGGAFDGSMLDKEKFKKMLEDYYEMRGWDRETGVPTRKHLTALGLEDIAHDIEPYINR